MTRIIFPLALMIALLVTSCASASPQTAAATPTLPAIEDEWTVKMTHSGGIMGLMRSVEVSSNGRYTVADERTKKEITGKLTDDELANLSEIVMRAKLVTSEMPGISACADCFIYDIEILNGGKKLTVHLDDISLPGSGMEGVVTFLRGLIDSALK